VDLGWVRSSVGILGLQFHRFNGVHGYMGFCFWLGIGLGDYAVGLKILAAGGGEGVGGH
jgi:hypothetical protein